VNLTNRRSTRRPWLALGILAVFLLTFFALPVGKMFFVGLYDDEGGLASRSLAVFLDNPLYAESLFNSIAAAFGAALLAALAALPVAIVLWRFRLQPPLILELFGFLPLFVPPFMLSLSLQTLLGRGGAFGMLFLPMGDIDPAMWGLPGLMVIEAIHYFPLVLMTLLFSTANYAQQAHEAARLGNSWFRLITRVFIPLGLPGMAFGMVITFLKTLDDLATPLSLGLTNLLAPQAYFRVSTYGHMDPLPSLMAITMIAISVIAWGVSAGVIRHGTTQWNVPHRLTPAALPARQRHLGGLFLASIAALYALCYSGMLLTSLAGIWSHTLFPESYVLSHYTSALESETGSLLNTLIYCGLAALLDVCIGLAVAHAIDRSPPRWKRNLLWGAAALLSIPGVALAIAYLQFFPGLRLPLVGTSIDASWFLLPMAFSVRGLPFAIQASTFALRSLPAPYVEAALLSGASRWAIVRRIILPMMAFGLLVVFLICFGIAAVDLSSAMLLIPSETDAPVSYSIYLHMQTSTGRGTGAALAVLTIAVVAMAMTAFVLATRRRAHPLPSGPGIVFPNNLPKTDQTS